METELKDLVGKKINKVFINPSHLRFETDGGNFTYTVQGDCCSSSFFYDFYGVKNLLEGGKVKEVKTVELHPTDLFVIPDKGESTSVYGYAITNEQKEDDYYGDRTSVFSFRNESNGYYGGWISKVETEIEVLPEITEDVLEVK
jgi:hypothetical protein